MDVFFMPSTLIKGERGKAKPPPRPALPEWTRHVIRGPLPEDTLKVNEEGECSWP